MQVESHSKVSIIIVTHDEKDEFFECIDSLQNETVPFEIFVVDNASNAEFRELLARRKGANLKVIFNDQNVGLAKANNEPLGMCRGDYVLILNPDTVIHNGAISKLCSYLDSNPEVGVVGPRILWGDGTVQPSFYTKWNPFRDAMVEWIKLPASVASRGASTTPMEMGDVLFVSGACLLIRRSTMSSAGGYDPNFFLSLEDVVDLCYRVRRGGHRVVYYPAAEVTHLGARGHKGYGSIYWGYQGHLYYQLKHHGHFQAMILRAEFLIDLVLETWIMLISSRFNEGHRPFLLAYTFTAGKLLTRRTKSLYSEGLRLNGLLANYRGH